MLLPVLKDNGTLDSRLGRAVLVLGAYGELGPIVAMAVLLWMRRDLDRIELMQAALYSTTTLPVLVALTGLAVDDGALPPNVGAAIVGAGVLSVISLPFVAGRLSGRGSEQDFAPDGASGTGCGKTRVALG